MNELIRVERFIAYFNIEDEDMVGEINVDAIPLEKLLTIILPIFETKRLGC